jgi:carbamoyltransferase
MLALGISDSHDASAVLIESDRVVAAASEERFTRKKRQQGFPRRSIDYLEKYFIRGRKIDKIFIAGKYGRSLFRVLDGLYHNTDPAKDILSFSSRLTRRIENTLSALHILRDFESSIGLLAVKARLNKLGLKYSEVFLFDHHYSHIISALSGMISENYLAVSLDAYGDGKSGLIIKVKDNKVFGISEISYRDSVAYFYAYICAYLGFTEGDEGKAMALAAFGKDTELNGIFSNLFSFNHTAIKIDPSFKSKHLAKSLEAYKKEDVAFALQKTVENVVVRLVKNYLLEGEVTDLFLCGGFFFNIKVNQRLNQTALFRRVFVFPHMGDGGIAFVSTLQDINPGKNYYAAFDFAGCKFASWKDVYLGPEYDEEYIKGQLYQSFLNYSYEPNMAEKIAFLLALGKTVALFNGRMEYGPRALGNRSILYQSTDQSAIDWLNKKLERPHYMPFAPVTLFEFKDKCYVNINGAEHAAKFMTISVCCTDWMKEVSPAAVHIDGTARPQLIKEGDNPFYYKIIKEYYNHTGIPSLLNTSFNIHGEPIVCSPRDAINTFKASGLDYLAMGNFLVENHYS